MESVACSIAGLESLRVGTPEQACAQVVLLHGYDMRPEDLEPFSHSLNIPALFHFPRGPLQSPSGNHCWWPIDQERRAKQLQSGPRDLCEESPPGRTAVRERLCAFLDKLRAGAPKLPLLLGGFSQGGMLACDTVLCARQPVSGLTMFSSSRIAFDDWMANREALAGLPVLVSHGTQDADLAFSAGEALRDFYRNSGARVTWQPFEGGHEIPLVVWRALRRFLTELSRKTD
jgi:phospholipase/carboxylesterase